MRPGSRIAEKDSAINELLLANLGEEHLSDRLIARWREPDMQKTIRVGINGGVQPELLVVELNHGLVSRDVIRIGANKRL